MHNKLSENLLIHFRDSLLDDKNIESSDLSLSVSTEHKSFITGLLPSSAVSQSVFVSSSLDGTCKVNSVSCLML